MPRMRQRPVELAVRSRTAQASASTSSIYRAFYPPWRWQRLVITTVLRDGHFRFIAAGRTTRLICLTVHTRWQHFRTVCMSNSHRQTCLQTSRASKYEDCVTLTMHDIQFVNSIQVQVDTVTTRRPHRRVLPLVSHFEYINCQTCMSQYAVYVSLKSIPTRGGNRATI